MNSIIIPAKNEYEYRIGPLSDIGKVAANVLTHRRICIVTDTNVRGLYLEKVRQSLSSAGFETFEFVFPAGEDSKNPDTLILLLQRLVEYGFDGSDSLLALGGGSVGDIAGLAAGLYHRGIPYIQAPTTLLSAIDSSVGGKTAVNLGGSKNAAGLIYQPRLTYFDLESLNSLPADELKSGLGEAAKYALISGAMPESVINENFVLSCVSVKAKFIAKDENDRGERAVLNLGHTAAHAIESLSSYKIKHGEAVAIGLYAETLGGYAIGNRYADSAAAKVLEILDFFGLSHSCPYGAAELFEAAAKDKKFSSGKIRFPLLTAFGKYEIRELSTSELKALFEEGFSK